MQVVFAVKESWASYTKKFPQGPLTKYQMLAIKGHFAV